MLWTVLKDSKAVADIACDRIQRAADKAIKQRGVFRLVMAGGSTPEQTYRLLSENTNDWAHWEIYLGDERCLPENHTERNSVMIKQALTDKVPIPDKQVFPISAELGAEKAAQEYEQVLESRLPFDLVLLGMGEDGHTASLFPGQRFPQGALVVPVYDAPKAPSNRVSLSEYSINQSRQLLVLISGVKKNKAVKQWRNGDDLPVSRFSGHENLEVLIDMVAFQNEE